MKREMKRNKLLKKALTLGLATAVAVTSMGPTLGMLNPMVAYANEEGTTTVVTQDGAQTSPITIAEASKATINSSLNLTENENKWKTNAEKVKNVTKDGNTITVLADFSTMETMVEGDTPNKAFPILVKLSSTVANGGTGYHIAEGNGALDSEDRKERITDAWKFNNKTDSTDYNNDYCVIWLSQLWIGKNYQISFDGTNRYTINVVDTVEIIDAKSAQIKNNVFTAEGDHLWIDNIASVASVTLTSNTITVKANFGSMNVMTGGDTGHKAFPIVVKLNKAVSNAYTIYENGTADGGAKGIERVNDAWAFTNDVTNQASYSEKKYCVIWLSEEWVGKNYQISFDGVNKYTITVEDTTPAPTTPTTPGDSDPSDGGSTSSGDSGSSGGGSTSSGDSGSSGGGSTSSGGSGSTSGGSSSGGSTGGSTGASTGTTGGTTTPTVVTTTTPDGTVVSTNKDGAYVDKDGKVAANTVIKESTGTMHVTDSTGHIVKDEVVTAADGTTYVVGAEGNVVVSDIAEIKGNKYVADEKGELVTSAFSTIGDEKYYSDAEGLVKTDGFFNAAGKKYYANEDGTIAVKELITVNGNTYFATKTGAIASKKIVTAGGKKYFATKSGKIAENKVVTTGGKKYFATKNGSLATNKWVKSGNKKYFCNKKGVITKTKKVK